MTCEIGNKSSRLDTDHLMIYLHGLENLLKHVIKCFRKLETVCEANRLFGTCKAVKFQVVKNR